jgi:hypothetical protein
MYVRNGICVGVLLVSLGCPGPSTITGTVRTLDGQPVTGAQVTIGTARVETDGEGVFSIPNVTPPYDVSVVVFSANAATVYQRLTRTNPNIIFLGLFPPYHNAGSVMGNVFGSNLSGRGADFVEIAWGSPEARADATAGSGTYSLSLSWPGPSSTTGNLHALQSIGDPSAPRTAYRYGTTSGVTVENGSMNVPADLTLSNVDAGHITGTVVLAANSEIAATYMYLDFDDGAQLGLFTGGASTSSGFSYLTPLGTGGTIALSAQSSPTTGGVTAVVQLELAPDATGVTLALHTPSMEVLPPDGGTQVTLSTDFTWTPFEGGITLVAFFPSLSTNPSYFVFTKATTGTIPDFSAQGLGLPDGGALYSWGTVGFAPFQDMDAFAGVAEVRRGLSGIVPTGATVAYESLSAGRIFATQ